MLERLRSRLEEEMETLAQSPYLARVMEPGFADKRLYAIYMCETYHYTKHNARNQALVATRKEDIPVNYMKYCLHHAEEEAGHEMMAFHDLKKIGIELKLEDLPKPLSSTNALIGYLYYVAENENLFARLGYSYWAERVYEFMQPLLGLMGEGLKIPETAMTFFVQHAEIDAGHAEEVDQIIERFIKNEEDYLAVEATMIASLKLTSKMLDEVFEEFVKIKEGKPTRYTFLEQLGIN